MNTRLTDKDTLTGRLAETIEARGLSAYAVGKLADLDPGIVQRFMTGKRDIYLGTADRIARSLGLRLVEVDRRKPARRAGTSNEAE